jgi:uncharacterized membrane protein YeaQ/YmgE (transglycosylase-associated protein family)
VKTFLLVTATILFCFILGGLAGWLAADIVQSAEKAAVLGVNCGLACPKDPPF